MAIYFYRVYGLTVRSDLPLPVLEPCEPLPTVDVTIDRGSVPVTLSPRLVSRFFFDLSANEMLVRLREPLGVNFFVQNGRTIRYQLFDLQLDREEIGLSLYFTCIWAILMQRGYLLLHGNTVVKQGDPCWLISGSAGAGKSTLAANLLQRGYRFLADDLCVIDPNPDEKGRYLVLPGPPKIKFWGEMAKAMGLPMEKAIRLRRSVDKYYFPVLHEIETQPQPLQGMVLLDTSDNQEIELVNLPRQQGRHLLHHQHYILTCAQLWIIDSAADAKLDLVSMTLRYATIRRPRFRQTTADMVEKFLAWQTQQ